LLGAATQRIADNGNLSVADHLKMYYQIPPSFKIVHFTLVYPDVSIHVLTIGMIIDLEID